jgi:sugar/nucleoside kinase (ribokinase family)
LRLDIPGGILITGSIVHDTVARPVGELRWNATQWLEKLETHMGGNGASTAYACAKLGAPVRLLGAVGGDAFGEELLARLNSADVDVSGVSTLDAPTAATVVLVNAAGARVLLHRPGVSEHLFGEPLRFEEHAAGGFRHFHLGNVYSLPAMRPHAAVTLANARAAGFTTSVDTGWDSRNEWMALLDPCLPHTDVLFVNREEGSMLTGLDDPPGAARLLASRGARVVVLKLGAAGCLLLAGNELMSVPGFSVPVVDTTGAGDCFAGAFLAALYHGYPLEQAARFANAAGAQSVMMMGATGGLLGLEETLEWMNERG